MKYNWNEQYVDLYERTLNTLLQAGVAQDFAEVLATERCILTALKRSGAIHHARSGNDVPLDAGGNIVQFPIVSFVLDVH